jgi:hypothetical protein
MDKKRMSTTTLIKISISTSFIVSALKTGMSLALRFPYARAAVWPLGCQPGDVLTCER